MEKVYIIGPTESVLTKRGNRFPNIAEFIFEKGIDVAYYTSNFYHAEKRHFGKNEIENAITKCQYQLKVIPVLGYYNNVSIRRVLSNFFFSLNVFIRLLFVVKKGEIVLLPSRPVELIFFISVLKRLRKVMIYLDIQDVWPDALKIENKGKKKVFEAYCNFFLYPSLKYYTNTFHVAPSFFYKWLTRYAPKVPSVFIPLGWENKRWEIIKENNYTSNNEVLKLVCVAQLQHQIDVMPILEVLKINKNIHFTIIGEDGTGERYPEVMKCIADNKIENVKIIGKVDRNEMVNLLSDKDIGILPMITSSIPNKIFDYMAACLPIIVLGENDSSRFVEENKIGWTCGYNSNDFSDLIKFITWTDLNYKKEILIKVRDMFSRDELHKEILKVII